MRLYDDKSGNGKGAAFVAQALAQGQINQVGVTEPATLKGLFNIQLSGDFIATIVLERRLNKASNFEPYTAGGVPFVYNGPCSESFDEPEPGAQYRFNCTSHTSGIAYFRISK